MDFISLVKTILLPAFEQHSFKMEIIGKDVVSLNSPVLQIRLVYNRREYSNDIYIGKINELPIELDSTAIKDLFGDSVKIHFSPSEIFLNDVLNFFTSAGKPLLDGNLELLDSLKSYSQERNRKYTEKLSKRRSPDFIALVKYKTTEEGGRRTPANSGHCPAIEFPEHNMRTTGEQIFIGKGFVYPGEAAKAQITLLSPKFFKGSLFVGQAFRFCESPKYTIGTGEILEILNKDLEFKSSDG